MLAEERQQEILKYIRRQKALTVQEIVSLFSVSEATARRDLLSLQASGFVNRVHGGATWREGCGAYDADWEDLQQKYAYHMEAKRRIARFAAAQIGDADFVYLDAGSTVEQMADFLSGSKASFVTNSLPLAQKLAHFGRDVLILPGRIKEKTAAIVGSEMRDMLRRYHFTKGFFGANGISLQAGCTTPDAEEGDCKMAALQHCRYKSVLADCSKFGLASHITFADLAEVSIITAQEAEHFDFTPFQQITEVHIV
ncbi:DeoR/GlpR family DNA-binding transcription regulator [Megasphaera vaginalis (ex Srinivasan et al. 2021)]|uniref:Transcriptional regulator, DeoR family n=1 Tax=Megasphaera vaginalis (ex Srinivasan et al. 2021) TaxID=1111454 RepID=U7UGW9_9FIRM|nr:DeoR/GlpR family DNA-binding transcription regulator [Megasphaera vaginalis (ex Srinivasan et al. 2021)]ERT58647.1 transcriptional regulator, DeoR family [Megasphaera vaginalis (ex Srinivasan et al. 2021)]